MARDDDGGDDDKRKQDKATYTSRMMRIAKESAGSGSVQSCREAEVRGWVVKL